MEWKKLSTYTILLLVILLFAFGVRMYYYSNYGDQALWYDESEYLLRSESFVMDSLEDAEGISERRPVLMPLIWSGVIALGGGELTIKFLQVLISVLGIYFMYLLGREVKGEKLGLIMAALMSFFWMHIFFSIRIMLDEVTLAVTVLAVYFFVRWYKKKRLKDAIYTGVLSGVALLLFYIPLYLVALFLAFLIILSRQKFLKEKTFWYGVLAYVLTLTPWLLWSWVKYGNPLYGFTSYHGSWEVLPGYDYGLWGFIKVIPTSLFISMFVFFLFGLAKSLFDVVISIDHIVKRKTKKYDWDLLFLFWMCGVTLALAIEIIHVEPRYMMPAFVGVFYFLAKGLVFLYEAIIKNVKVKNVKIAASILIMLILVYFAFTQVTYADSLIETKAEGFEHEKTAGYWLAENMGEDDFTLVCNNVVSYQAYSGISMKAFGSNETRLESMIVEYDADYVVLSAYSADCTFDYLIGHPEKFNPVQVYYFDEAQTQAVVVIYEIL